MKIPFGIGHAKRNFEDCKMLKWYSRGILCRYNDYAAVGYGISPLSVLVVIIAYDRSFRDGDVLVYDGPLDLRMSPDLNVFEKNGVLYQTVTVDFGT